MYVHITIWIRVCVHVSERERGRVVVRVSIGGQQWVLCFGTGLNEHPSTTHDNNNSHTWTLHVFMLNTLEIHSFIDTQHQWEHSYPPFEAWKKVLCKAIMQNCNVQAQQSYYVHVQYTCTLYDEKQLYVCQIHYLTFWETPALKKLTLYSTKPATTFFEGKIESLPSFLFVPRPTARP